MRKNRPVTEFLTADYTFINEPLVMHYDLKSVSGQGFQRVSLRHTKARRAHSCRRAHRHL